MGHGCRRDDGSSPAPSSTPKTEAIPSSPTRAAIETDIASTEWQTRLEQAHDEADRKELVSPPAPGFKPRASGKLLDILLIPRSKMIRRGESLWFRAEIRNVGSEPVLIEDPFIKSGSGNDGWSRFKLTISPAPPKGVAFGNAGEPCQLDHPPIPGWDRMSEEQRRTALVRWTFEETSLRSRTRIELRPGETLRTRDWRPASREESCAAARAGKPDPTRPGGPFREHDSPSDFSKPGTYVLQLSYDDPGAEPREQDIDALRQLGRSQAEIDSYVARVLRKPPLRAESAPIRIEVLP